MISQKLYDVNSKIKEFDCKVISCQKDKEFFKVILDKTAFFPEAGGQPCDKGIINDLEVIDVQIQNDEIIHFVKEPLNEGEFVHGEIDYKRRFGFMQNHSAEHIISGIVYKNYGFQNVGFHLNEEFVTLDFDGIFTSRQLEEIEYCANKAVWENRSIKAYYPEKSQLDNISFRQKKEIQGEIRLVDIEGVDICACCAPHVEKTGEIGVIKLISTEKMRGGTRIYMKSGMYALKDYSEKLSSIQTIQNLLSVKPNETAQAVNLLLGKLAEEKQVNTFLKERIINLFAFGDKDKKILFAENFEMKDLQNLADKRYNFTKNTAFVLSKRDTDNYSFVICGEESRVNPFFSHLKEKLNIKGGGKGGMISGNISAESLEKIEEFENELD